MSRYLKMILITLIIGGIPLLASPGKTLYKTLPLSDGQSIPYAVHLPDEYDPGSTYPVLIGPGEGVEGEDPGFYWQNDPYSHGWIIVDAQLWEEQTRTHLNALLDAILKAYKVEGGKFHTACWSANSAGFSISPSPMPTAFTASPGWRETRETSLRRISRK